MERVEQAEQRTHRAGSGEAVRHGGAGADLAAVHDKRQGARADR